MAERRDGGRQGDSGTAGGTDVEPLRGGMEEVSRGNAGERETSARKDPAAPYHEAEVPEGGLAPRGAAQGGGSAPPQRAPDKGGGEVQRDAGGKIGQERGDHENEGGNVPREDPGAPGAASGAGEMHAGRTYVDRAVVHARCTPVCTRCEQVNLPVSLSPPSGERAA